MIRFRALLICNSYTTGESGLSHFPQQADGKNVEQWLKAQLGISAEAKETCRIRAEYDADAEKMRSCIITLGQQLQGQQKPLV
jgi:hypothetical protein